jgi:hypothetical protein
VRHEGCEFEEENVGNTMAVLNFDSEMVGHWPIWQKQKKYQNFSFFNCRK